MVGGAQEMVVWGRTDKQLRREQEWDSCNPLALNNAPHLPLLTRVPPAVDHAYKVEILLALDREDHPVIL